ncbi:MAG TPA: hypothetical protein VIY51_21500 [Xanthobacteraceae bacterium]
MLAAISNAIVTSATSTSSLLAAESSSAVTRCQADDCRGSVRMRQKRKVRTSASVTKFGPPRSVTGRARGRDQRRGGLGISAGESAKCSVMLPQKIASWSSAGLCDSLSLTPHKSRISFSHSEVTFAQQRFFDFQITVVFGSMSLNCNAAKIALSHGG